ncbi:hypothetical protein [Paraglaciecola sp.]|uniref:hypothetical protein n=1 Tax=Paraglaciecola sp. TaxID=1920173 RepID=UPI0030F44769
MKYAALVLVNSSFQLMCALEYLLKNATCHNVLVVTSEDPKGSSYQQMLRLTYDFDIHKIDNIVVAHSGSLEERIGSYGDYYAKNIKDLTFEHVVLGDVRHQWIQDYTCSVKANNIVMVDDGGAVFSIIKYILAPLDFKLPFYPTNSGTVSRRELAGEIKRSYGMHVQPTKLSLFSLFHQQIVSDVVVNDFSKIIEFYNPTKHFACLNEAHIIGAPFVEHHLLSQYAYLTYIESLASVARYYQDIKLVYFMHRFEKDNHVKNAALAALGYELRVSEINYELALIQAAQKPRLVGSVISTSLYNVKAIFAEQVEAIFVPLQQAHLDLYRDTNWMVDKYTLAQHWQHIIEHFPHYDILPLSEWSQKHV